MKEQIGKQIADFWKGLLSKEQQQDLLGDIQIQEKEIQEDLKSVFGIERREDGLATEERYENLLKNIHAKMEVPEQKEQRTFRLTSWSIAAAALIAIALGFYTFSNQNEYNDLGVQDIAKVSDTVQLINDQPKEQSAVLADGSTVILSPGSSLTYTKYYGESDRKIKLVGRARFKVARDTSLPFVVWANEYTTTALGTDFTVDTRRPDQLDIHLLSGKIMVKAEPGAKVLMDNQYLSPGDKLHILTNTGSITLDKAKKKPSAVLKHISEPPARPADEVISFQDSPLDSVFQSIAHKKGVSISTNTVDLTGLTFTGEFQSSESTKSIIGIVCQMNGLRFTETAEGNITIAKKVTELSAQTLEEHN